MRIFVLEELGQRDMATSDIPTEVLQIISFLAKICRPK